MSTNKTLNLKKTLLSIVCCTLLISLVEAQTDSQLPPNPKPGKCYVKCVTPDEFERRDERILVTPEHTRIEVKPATYKTVTERVMIKEGTKRYVYRPAEFEAVQVSYVGKAGRNDFRVIPAKLSPSSQRIQVYPAVARWEYTSYSECASPNPEDCQVICWKEYPARFRTISTQVLDNDASTTSAPVAELPKTYTKRVVKTQARVEEIVVEAEYATITKRVIDRPASTERIKIGPIYETVTKEVLVKKGGVTVWEEIDCKLTQAVLLPILWDFNSAVVNAESKQTINETLLTLLRDKPNISIELASHTDARGNDAYNQSLSQRRAEAIKNYLVSRGINRNRVISKGYGESRLKNRCSNGVRCSEEEHQVNRRTEYRVLGSRG